MINKVKRKQTTQMIVVKYFVRVIKNHGMYKIFTKSFNRIASTQKNDYNPFGEFENIYELSNKLKVFSDENRSPFRNKDEYTEITNMINHLLHFFLENGGIKPSTLGEYGQEIFDLSCFELFGDKYSKDKENMEKDSKVPKPRNEKERWIINMFLDKKSHGDFNGNFNDFMNYVEQATGTSYDRFIGLNNNEDFIDLNDDEEEEEDTW